MKSFSKYWRLNLAKGICEEIPSLMLADRLRRNTRGDDRITPMGRRHQAMQQQQTSYAPLVLGWQALAFVDSDAVTPVYRRQRGFASTAITRNGAGDYTLTLSDAVDAAADLLLQLTVQNNALAFGAIDVPTATTLRTRTASATAVPAITAADLDYFVFVGNFGPN